MNGSEQTEIFLAHRPRLMQVAYRMLGSREDAEDLLQEAYLRWSGAACEAVRSPIAILVTITKRLCIDRLRLLKQERQHVRESLPGDADIPEQIASPAMQMEYAEDVTAAFEAMLQRLKPHEREVLLLHDVFDYDYQEVSRVLGKTEPACRQMIHRARIRARHPRPRIDAAGEKDNVMLAKFLSAARSGAREAILDCCLVSPRTPGRSRLRRPARVAARRAGNRCSVSGDAGK